MSDYEIAKALHDYLALNCEYDKRYYSGSMPYVSYTAYGALVNRTSVCAGYALAYERLMDQVGIPCEYVTGMTTNGYHAWNIIQIDGEWYHVDVTWDDPTPDREGYVRYKYFLKSDKAMSRDHISWVASHTCTSTKYDNVTILSPEDEQEAIEKAEEEAREEAVTAEIITYCKQQCRISVCNRRSASGCGNTHRRRLAQLHLFPHREIYQGRAEHSADEILCRAGGRLSGL